MSALRLSPGAVFASDFRIRRTLGRGGMGAVYVVEQISTGYDRVLKLMHAHLAEDEALRKRFIQEARVGAKIKSDHVVQVIASGVDAETGTPWLVMELLEGDDLKWHAMRKGLLPIPEIREITAQLGHALTAAFEADVVHRDLKPDNLFIATSRRSEAAITLKVLDFGIAKVLSDASAHTTAPLGTLAWMAPEQAQDGASITPRTDVWPVGLLAYFLLTGEPYWRNAKATAAELLTEVLLDPLPPASERAAQIGASQRLPTGFDAWFARCVARDPNARFAHGGEACSALFPLLRDGFTEAVADTQAALGQAPVATSSSPPKAAPPEPARPAEGAVSKRGSMSKERRAAPRAILGFIALAVAAVVVTRWPRKAPLPADPASPSASMSAAPRPTAITDLPPPASKSPEALAEYAAAMQAIRDANWDHARERLERAVTLDPSFAAAHMRLVMCTEDNAAKRAAYARAEAGRSALSERDRMLLRALELDLDYAPSDPAKLRAIYREMAERFPLDAEIAGLVAETEEGFEAVERAIDHALSLDPLDANLWHTKANNLRLFNKAEEALRALDRCLAISPRSKECQSERARALGRLGRCEEEEEALQKTLQSRPHDEDLLDRRIHVMRALGRPHEALVEVMALKWSRVPEPRRRAVELLDRIGLSYGRGDFALAESQAKELHAALTPELAERYATSLAYYKIQLYQETGRDRDAARAADEHLRRLDAWSGYFMGTETIMLLRVMAHGGLLSKEQLATRTAAYLERAKKKTPPFSTTDLWLIENGGHSFSPEEARAVAARPSPDLAAVGPRDLANLAHAYVLADKPTEALQTMKLAMRSCSPIRVDPMSTLWLGQALEGTGDKAGACRDYAKVVGSWGKAKPRSVTAEEAARRAKALGCGAPPR